MASTYRAVEISSPGVFSLVERKVAFPGAGQVRIRVEACGVCHSDAATVEAQFPNLSYPRVPGHEVIGRIEEVGPGVPVAAQLLGTSDGKVVGKASLEAYFRRGLEAYPELHFRLADVLCGINSVVLYYTNQKGTRTAEFMELSATGKVARVVANYGT